VIQLSVCKCNNRMNFNETYLLRAITSFSIENLFFSLGLCHMIYRSDSVTSELNIYFLSIEIEIFAAYSMALVRRFSVVMHSLTHFYLHSNKSDRMKCRSILIECVEVSRVGRRRNDARKQNVYDTETGCILHRILFHSIDISGERKFSSFSRKLRALNTNMPHIEIYSLSSSCYSLFASLRGFFLHFTIAWIKWDTLSFVHTQRAFLRNAFFTSTSTKIVFIWARKKHIEETVNIQLLT
jgi:hypothetical protein